MITLKTRETIIDQRDIEEFGREFRARKCALLKGLLDPELLALLLPRIEGGHWGDYVHEGIGTEDVMNDDRALNLLHFAANTPAFLDAVRRIADCDNISWFSGRIYRLVPGAGHYDSWHHDNTDNRLVGMSINLSSGGYEGGLFELRDAESRALHAQIANTGLGDASLFRISSSLEHRVGPLTGTRPRTAFAGWFCSGQPDLLSRLRQAAAARSANIPTPSA